MQIADIIEEAARRRGVSPAYMRRTAEIESGMNPRAKNPNSSAGGLFQFIDGTARQYGLADRFDPVAASDAAARLAADNRSILQRALGRDPQDWELYLAHQQGAGGASKLLANPQASAASLVSPEAVALNGGDESMRASDFAEIWRKKFGGSPQPGTAMPASIRPQSSGSASSGIGYSPPPGEDQQEEEVKLPPLDSLFPKAAPEPEPDFAGLRMSAPPERRRVPDGKTLLALLNRRR